MYLMNSFRLVFSIPFSVFENPKETVFLVFDILLEKHGTDELKNEPGCNDIFLKGSEGCYIYSNRHQGSKKAISEVAVKSWASMKWFSSSFLCSLLCPKNKNNNYSRAKEGKSFFCSPLKDASLRLKSGSMNKEVIIIIIIIIINL